MFDFAITLGDAAQVGIINFTYQRACARLAPVTSHLEGVGNYHAACAAITLVHYTPPPFIAHIVHCKPDAVKFSFTFSLPANGCA
jgi:hypothetical protein